MKVTQLIVLILLGFVIAETASAGMEPSYKIYERDGKFEDALADLQDAIVDKGLVIDFVGNVGGMLERTSKAVGSDSSYSQATYLTFCSSKLTHAATNADPQNIAICPYVAFLYELKGQPGKIHIGYRRPLAGTSDASIRALGEIESLLESIVKDALN